MINKLSLIVDKSLKSELISTVWMPEKKLLSKNIKLFNEDANKLKGNFYYLTDNKKISINDIPNAKWIIFIDQELKEYSINKKKRLLKINRVQCEHLDEIILKLETLGGLEEQNIVLNQINNKYKADIKLIENFYTDLKSSDLLQSEYYLFLDFVKKLVRSSSVSEIQQLFKQCYTNSKLFVGISFSSIPQVSEYTYPVVMNGQNSFITLTAAKGASGYHPMIGAQISLALNDYYREDFCRENLDEVDRVWEDAFSKIPFPIVFMSESSDIILHNSKFLELNVFPRECLELKDGEKIELKERVYKISRVALPYKKNAAWVFIFSRELKQNEKKISSRSSEDLGIISSSIAHELNNPLAGILAAISCLALEDEWSEDALKSLMDMKEGSTRCKELVEIFLGLSRVRPDGSSGSWKQAIEQALNLLRFRMIESNFRFNLDITDIEVINSEGTGANQSVVAMVIYLILSDIMTSKHHEFLVIESDSKGPFEINGDVEIAEQGIQIKFSTKENIDFELQNSKLVNHLLDLDKLILTHNENIITINKGM
jgi:hypothetical protein